MSPCKKGGEHYYIEWLQNNNQKEHRRLSCLDAAEKYEKVESINTQNDLVTASKNWSDFDQKQTCSLCFVNLLMFLNSKKTISRSFKRISRK